MYAECIVYVCVVEQSTFCLFSTRHIVLVGCSVVGECTNAVEVVCAYVVEYSAKAALCYLATSAYRV